MFKKSPLPGWKLERERIVDRVDEVHSRINDMENMVQEVIDFRTRRVALDFESDARAFLGWWFDMWFEEGKERIRDAIQG